MNCSYRQPDGDQRRRRRGLLVDAAVRAALLNVDINVPLIKDAAFAMALANKNGLLDRRCAERKGGGYGFSSASGV